MPKMKEQAVYQITVTERQLKLINAALEEFFRIGLNQWGDLAERVANIGFEYPPKDMPNRELVFDRHPRRDGNAPVPVLRNSPLCNAAPDCVHAQLGKGIGTGRICWNPPLALLWATCIRLRQHLRHCPV